MASKTPLVSKNSDLRIVLVGMVQVGKTSVKNAFVRFSEDNENPASPCCLGTEEDQKEKVKIEGRNVVIVETPGLRNANKEDNEVVKEIKRCVSRVNPGPHAFLFVLKLGVFTGDRQKTVEIIKETFGQNVLKYTMILFTNGEELSGQTIEDFIKGNKDLEAFVDKCKGGYHVLSNIDQNPSEVRGLLQAIDNMVEENGRRYYTPMNFRLFVGGFALAGAIVGGVASHFVERVFGIPIGLGVGAFAGALLGCVVRVGVENVIELCVRSEACQQRRKERY